MDDAQVNSDNQRDGLDIVSNASLIDFLNNEENCEQNIDELKLFTEINRLATLNSSKFDDEHDDRTIEELLKEAETLINQPIGGVDANFTISCESTPLELRKGIIDQYDYSTNKTLSHPDVSLFTLLYFRYSVCKNFHECERFLSGGDDLIRWKYETVASCVSQLNRVRIFKFHCSFCPIVTSTSRWIK
jgi:hypothetical protein